MDRENSVNNKEFQEYKESGQCVRLQTPMELTVISDSCDESRHRGNRCFMLADQEVQQPATSVVQNKCIEPTTVNVHDDDKCLATNKCVLHYSTLMGNQWLSNAFSRFTSSVLGKRSGERWIILILIPILSRDQTQSRILTSSSNITLYSEMEF